MTDPCQDFDHDFQPDGEGYRCSRCGHGKGAYSHALYETAKEMARFDALPEGERIDIEIKVRRKEIAELEAKISALQERRKSL